MELTITNTICIFHQTFRVKTNKFNKKCQTTHAPLSSPSHIIGYFVIDTCHKWVPGRVQLIGKKKNKNNEDFVINSFQDNEQTPF
jgi:hypothetical protein